MSASEVQSAIVVIGFITVAASGALGRRPSMLVRGVGTFGIIGLYLYARLTDLGSVDLIFAVTLFGLALTSLSEGRARRKREAEVAASAAD